MIRFPHYTQRDKSDCGPSCLKIVAKSYVLSVHDTHIERLLSRTGSDLMSISDVAECIGFHTIRTKLSWLQLRDQADLPCIVHWNQNHFIVVYRIAKKHGKWFVYVSDPAIGLLKYTAEQFIKSWLEIKGEGGELDKGIALILNPTSTLHN